MDVKITHLMRCAVFFLLMATGAVHAQTVTGFSPTRVTHRTPVIITGTGFTSNIASNVANVKFGGVNAESITFLSATQIRAIVPLMAVTGNVTVTNNAGSNVVFTGAYTYVAPAATPVNAGITRIITNYNGYWSSASGTTNGVSNNNLTQPDLGHSVMAFRYSPNTNGTNAVLYTTGDEAAITNVLATGGLTAADYTVGNFRALPINNIEGVVPSGTGNPNLIVLASRIDGSSTTQVPTAPSVAGLGVRDVLIDGIRGLNIGTGVTNLPSTSILNFQSGSILANNDPADNIPDILVSQVAEPSNNSFSVYCFLDANGNIVGNPVQIALNSVNPLGTYKTDFFTLQAGQPINTAVINGSTIVGANTRQIRMVAYRLSDFGITAANKNQVAQFRVMPSGTSDPAFMAYNRNSFNIPAPEIVNQPTSQAVCPGGTASFSVTVSAQGTELTYQWERNGVALTNGGNISGANTATLTINPVGASDAAVYRCLVTNSSGAAFSNSAYLNTVILSATGGGACLNTTPNTNFVEVGAQGVNLQYQWFANGTNNSNTGGTLIPGATASTYTPANTTAGTTYYYAKVKNQGFDCTEVTSNAVPYIVGTTGARPADRTICSGSTTTLTLTGSTGSVQWQQSATANGTFTNVTTGTGGTTASYTTPALTTTTYYRAVVTSANCSQTSDVVTVTVQTTNIWEGDVDTDWNKPGNWACGVVPTLTTDARIPVVASPNVYPVIDGLVSNGLVADVRNLTIDAGASIQIVNDGAGNMRIAGTVTNNGTLDAKNGTVTFIGTTGAQTIPANVFLDNYIRNLTLDNASGVTLNGVLNLTGVLNPKAGAFTTGNQLTLKSNAATTAIIAPVTGSVNGTMTIERYIPGRRAFRFISSPVNGGSIQSNWQEGKPVTDPIGLGTDITGTGGAANGFDVSGSNNPSLFTYDNAAGTWNAVTSTTANNLIAGKPLRMLIRGDRTIDQTSNAALPTNTTLRSTGTIVAGNVVVSDLRPEAGKKSYVGNPYQAPVDMSQVLVNGTNVNPNFYYVWDPTLGGAPTLGEPGGRGAYVTVMFDNSGNGYNAAGSAANKYLMPNQACFVETLANGPASVTFRETYKTLLTNLTPNVYRTGNQQEEQPSRITMKLYDTNSLALNDTPTDGLTIEFGQNYTNDADVMDAVKMTNQDENLARINGDKKLSVERRALPQVTDVLPLFNNQYRRTNYSFVVSIENITGVTALLLDKYTQTMTELTNNSNTVYNFTVNATDSLSVAENRFDIVFDQPAMGTDTYSVNDVKVYPNPNNGSVFYIAVPENAENTVIEIYNTLGQKVYANSNVQSGNVLRIEPQTAMAAGIYTVRIKNNGKTSVRKLMIK